MNSKKIVVLISVLGSVAAFVANNSVNLGLCLKPQIDCRTSYDTAEHIFYFFPVLLLVSIFSLLVSDSWGHWFRFAKFAAPACFVMIVAINLGVLHTSTYGTFGWGSMLNQTYDFVGLGLAYGIFVVGSLVQIFRGYRKSNNSPGLS